MREMCKCVAHLECRDPAGLENGKLADENLIATSNYKTYYGQNARLNGKSAWCTNITDGSQTLTVS